MRIATSQYHSTMNTALQTATAQTEGMLERMASGKRLRVPSDDPVSAVRLSRLNREESALGQYRDNIGALRTRMQKNEALLDSMSNDMLAARDLMVWAADGANTSEDIGSMAESLKALRDSLYFNANSRDQEGRYLFSGTATATAPVAFASAAAAGSRYAWAGNQDPQMVVVGNGIQHSANVSLGDIHTLLNQLDSAVAVFETPGVSINDPAVRSIVVSALDGIDAQVDTVSGLIAGQGGGQKMLQTLDDNHANVSLANQQAAIDIGQLDYSDAAIKLQGYTSALQATQKAYAKVAGLSLFDVL